MEKLDVQANGQWSLVKADISTIGYKVKHMSTNDGKSLYSISHKDHGNVGHAEIDHKSNSVKPLIDSKFDGHVDHIGNSIKAHHIARNTDPGSEKA